MEKLEKMESVPVETEVLSNETTATVEKIDSNTLIDNALQEWAAYQLITKKILDETDYLTIKGKKFKKKSAWRKYARAFNITTEIIKENSEKNDKNRVTEATFIIRATLPDGRFADGWGNCSRGEGSKNHPNHDIPATACTRATNRAISDLIGAGEVSSDEI